MKRSNPNPKPNNPKGGVMNKVSYGNQPTNTPTIIFEDANGNEFSFGIPKGSRDALVSAKNKSGKKSTAKPATLSIEWICAFNESAIDALKDDGVVLMKTPLGDYFELSKDDLRALRDFILKHYGKNN